MKNGLSSALRDIVCGGDFDAEAGISSVLVCEELAAHDGCLLEFGSHNRADFCAN